MTRYDAKWLEAWRLIGKLQNEIADVREQIRDLKQQRAPRRESAGNVMSLPGVALGRSKGPNPNEGDHPGPTVA
jgi:hypothetical protein